MVLMPPQKFDRNEWFQIALVVIQYPTMIMLPKRFPYSITLLLIVCSLFVSRIVDSILSLPPLDLYDFNDTPKQDVMDVLINFLYAPFGYFFIYFYDKWHVRKVNTAFYILAGAILSTGFEWICLKVNLFRYNGWELIYSFPTYLFTLSMYLLFFHAVRHYFEITKLR